MGGQAASDAPEPSATINVEGDAVINQAPDGGGVDNNVTEDSLGSGEGLGAEEGLGAGSEE